MLTTILIYCEGSTTRERIVRNYSSKAFQVPSTTVWNEIEVNSILPRASATTSVSEQRGGTGSPENPALPFTTLLLINSDNDTATKDFKIQENRDIEVNHTR